MYKRAITSVAAAIIAAILLLTLGPLGANATCDPQRHIVVWVSQGGED